jgi:A/G-specific adenine glycosylase
LPWRLTRDPYAVLVSEVMLQQTQVERVLPYYEAWLARWPGFATLAQATPADAIRAWAGLGYNRRAVNLQRLAVQVVEQHAGQLPTGEAELRQLPGIGAYTASAVQSFARDDRVTVLDTNVGRVIARWALGIAGAREVSPTVLRAAAEEGLPQRGVRDHNLALMDLGATVCRSRAPECGGCPLKVECAWRAAGYPEGRIRAERAAKFEETARFARGRLVDALRGAEALSAAELGALLPPLHRTGVAGYLDALEHDSVIVRCADGAWSLPGAAQGSKSMASPKL